MPWEKNDFDGSVNFRCGECGMYNPPSNHDHGYRPPPKIHGKTMEPWIRAEEGLERAALRAEREREQQRDAGARGAQAEAEETDEDEAEAALQFPDGPAPIKLPTIQSMLLAVSVKLPSTPKELAHHSITWHVLEGERYLTLEEAMETARWATAHVRETWTAAQMETFATAFVNFHCKYLKDMSPKDKDEMVIAVKVASE